VSDQIEGYVDGSAWSTEGYRTAYVVCRRCGAAVILHPSIDAPAVHTAWHLETMTA